MHIPKWNATVCRLPFAMAFGERQKIVGKALRQAREEAGLQQIELGRLIGKTQGYISKIEGGHQGVDVLLLHDIANALGNEPADLYARITAELP